MRTADALNSLVKDKARDKAIELVPAFSRLPYTETNNLLSNGGFSPKSRNFIKHAWSPAEEDSFAIKYSTSRTWQGIIHEIAPISGVSMFCTDVPPGASVQVLANTSTSISAPLIPIIESELKEGLNVLTFEQVDISSVQITVSRKQGSEVKLYWAVPLTDAKLDDATVGNFHAKRSLPPSMGRIEKLSYNDEYVYSSNINDPENTRSGGEATYAAVSRAEAMLGIGSNTWRIEDERLLCGIKIVTSNPYPISVSVLNYGYWNNMDNVINEAIIDGGEFIHFFEPRPSLGLEISFNYSDLSNSYYNRIYSVELYYWNPEPVLDIAQPVSVRNPSVLNPFIIANEKLAIGSKLENVALASNGATVTADPGTYSQAPPGRAIDGDHNTDWISWDLQHPWIKVDFPEIKLINKLVIHYEYMESAWVVEGLDEDNDWVLIAQESSRAQGFWGTVTYTFDALALRAVRIRTTGWGRNPLEAIWEIEAYEADLILEPLQVNEKARNPEPLRFQKVGENLNENIQSAVPWKVNLIALNFSSNALKTYHIDIEDTVQNITYQWKRVANTEVQDVVITEELKLTKDQKLKLRTIGVAAGNTVSALVNREER